jgi:predicted RNA binding protein YcfA (HicA-like mRNA interferase family)
MKVVKVFRIIKMLEKDGWYIARQKGSHRQFKHPSKKGAVTVNGHPSDDVWGNLLSSIEGQSGLVF